MVQARKEMQALASEDLRGSLFGFEGADKAPTLWRKRERTRERGQSFLCILSFSKESMRL